MRIMIHDCSKPTGHPMHVQTSRSMYSCEEGREIYYLCPGGRLGDKRIRESDDLLALVEEVRDS